MATQETETKHLSSRQRRKLLGLNREWHVNKEFMPDVIMAINRVQKLRFNEYLCNEFSQTPFAKNDNAFKVIDTSKYPEYVFLQSSNSHKLCLQLWNDQCINKYLHQTYLVQSASMDLNYIANHPKLFSKNMIVKLLGDKECITKIGPLIPKQIELSPSQRKCTHVLNIVRVYQKYYFGIFDKEYCYGYLATEKKLSYSQFADAAISRAYFKLREVFLRESVFLKSLPSEFIALDIGSSPGGWTKYLVDAGCKHVYSVDPGKLNLDKTTMQKVTYYGMSIEKCMEKGYFEDILFDIIVCDVNMVPVIAVELIDELANNLKDDGFVVFTLKNANRHKGKRDLNTTHCVNVLSEKYENIKMRHLFANKSKERTLIASKKKSKMIDDDCLFHNIHSF